MASVALEDIASSNSAATTERKRSRSHAIKVVLVVGTMLTMVFSILACSHCTFVRTDERVLGIFGAAQYDPEGNLLGCVSIYGDEVKIDGLYTMARAFGTVTALFVTGSFALLLYVLAFSPKQSLWKMIRYMMTGATMTSMFIFSIVGSSFCNREDCRLFGVGILNIFNVFLLASLSVMMHIDKPPLQPMFQLWSDELFTINKDTLAVESTGSLPEFMSHEDARRNAEGHASDCAASVDVMELEVVDGQPRFAQSSPSVFSEQASIQDSLLTTVNVQRSRCFRYMMLVMITLAWALSIFSVRRCTLIMVSSKEDVSSQKFGMGIFSRAVYHEGNMLGCLVYPEQALETLSGAFKASRVFGTVAALLMSLVLVCGILQLFSTIAKDPIWRAIRVMVSVALICQALVFLAFKSNTCRDTDLIECEIGSAGMMTIINCLVLLGLVVLSWAVPPPANPLFARFRPKYVENERADQDDHGRHDITYIEHGGPKLSIVQEVDEVVERVPDYDADEACRETRGAELITVRVEFGRTVKKTIKEITHADGSKTITTITEPVQEGHGEEESTVASIGHVMSDDASLGLDSDTEDVKIIL